MLDRRVRDIYAFPSAEPHLPAKIHVLAIHEKKALIEFSGFIKSPTADERGRPGAPAGLTGRQIVSLGMLPGILPCFAYSNPAVGQNANHQLLQTSFVDFRVRI